ncbi:MAG: anaerobic ribonucleoside-triphosphate reductase activating protein [Tannerellaceae bacterium]|jgi:anaerobic ribonucleoside-triphosphate reductase activating protein|nr:anaerobic ribonucleoside-triphosphate reductase activating protein [Tannerellaceae bacterium]
MLRYLSYDIVFQEIPGEVSLAINISNCPNRCKDCHSPQLWENIGEALDEKAIAYLLDKYGNAITCICFMGGDAYPQTVADAALFSKATTNGRIKTGWYSGRNALPEASFLHYFDFIKLGAYKADLGGLDSLTTNQRFYRIVNGEMRDCTNLFRKSRTIANAGGRS